MSLQNEEQNDESPEIFFQNIKTNLEYYFFYIVDLVFGRNHIDKVFNHLYIGNIYTALNTDILEEHNIEVVVNCTTDIPFLETDFIKDGYRCPLEDDKSKEQIDNMLASFDSILDIIRKHIENNQNVFIHCRAGVQRSATIVVGYLMKYNQMSLERAMTYLKHIRDCVFYPQANFIESLKTYEQILKP